MYNVHLTLAPNMKTGIKVMKNVMTRQLAPYTTNCSDKYPPGIDANIALDFSNTNYSQSYCKTVCLVRYVQQKCGCLDPSLMEANFLDQITPINFKYCSMIKNSDKRHCAVDAVNNYSIGTGVNRNCSCQSSCYEESYEVSN